MTKQTTNDHRGGYHGNGKWASRKHVWSFEVLTLGKDGGRQIVLAFGCMAGNLGPRVRLRIIEGHGERLGGGM